MNEQEFWFRYEDRRYAPPVDEFDRPIGEGSMDIMLRKYPVIKYTPKGVWLDLSFNDHRFVLIGARKRFACPTVEEAKVSFIARKRRQASIYRARMNSAEKAIAIIEGRSLFGIAA